MAARVLIVEDDPAQRRILEEMVKRFGFEPVSIEGLIRERRPVAQTCYYRRAIEGKSPPQWKTIVEVR